MSNGEEPNREDKVSQTNDPVLEEAVSFVKGTQTPDSQHITINFYGSDRPSRIDKPVQTDSSCTVVLRRSSSNLQNRIQQSVSQELRNQELRDQVLRSQEIRNLELRSKELRNQELKSLEIGSKRHFSLNVYKKRPAPLLETWSPRFMKSRKAAESKAAARAASDLERKKLEAEYKAAQELAKIQKSVIEKRLALELASLEDNSSTSCHSVPQFSEAELRVLEELKKKTALMSQTNEPVPKKESPRASPPPGPPQSTKTNLNECPIIAKADSSGPKHNSSELNPLRHLFEKKLNLDLKSQSKPSFLFKVSPSSSQERECNEIPVNVQSSSKDMFKYEEERDEPSCSPETLKRLRPRNIWEEAYEFFKKKIDHEMARMEARKAARGGAEGKKTKRKFRLNKRGLKKKPDFDEPGAGSESKRVVMTP